MAMKRDTIVQFGAPAGTAQGAGTGKRMKTTPPSVSGSAAPPFAAAPPAPLTDAGSIAGFSASGSAGAWAAPPGAPSSIVPSVVSGGGSGTGDSAGSSVGEEGMCGQRSLPGCGSAVSCWFECGQTAGLYNIGNTRAVKLVCGLCNSSRKALDYQARADKHLRLVLDDLKKNRQATYKQKVRAGRIIPDSAEHPHSAGERAAMLAEYSQEVQIQSTVSDASEVLWPNRVEYCAYREFWHKLSPEQANAEFEKALRNPDIKVRGTDADPRVPLTGVPRTQGSVSRSFSRRMNVYTGITNQGQLDVAGSRMNLASLPSMSTGMYNDVGGGNFLPGAASGASDSAMVPIASSGSQPFMTYAEMEGTSLRTVDEGALPPLPQQPEQSRSDGPRQGQRGQRGRRLAARPSDAGEGDARSAHSCNFRACRMFLTSSAFPPGQRNRIQALSIM